MSKSRKRKPTAKSIRPLKSQGRSSGHWSTGRKWVSGISAVFSAIGLASAGATFLPHLTIDPGGAIDPSKPYPVPFTITNRSIIPLSDVQPSLGICEIYYGEPKNLAERCGKMRTYFSFTPWFVHKIAPDETYTIHLDEFLNVKGKFGAADISIKVEYYPWILTFWPFRNEKEFRFQTRLGSDGKLWWKDRPLEK
ncbi:MAG: hypothetical protein ACT4O2_08345 [Beijerinckiaceae bacterium]